jgi:hypothetical protein
LTFDILYHSYLKMAPPSITTTLATEEDASRLASIMTAGFAASDAAYPLIWRSAPEGTHDTISVKGLFTPVQKEGRVTFKAVDETDKIVGFATWNLPKEKVSEKAVDGKKGGGLPPLPGVNIELWEDKSSGPKEFYYRDVDPTKDLRRCLLKPCA